MRGDLLESNFRYHISGEKYENDIMVIYKYSNKYFDSSEITHRPLNESGSTDQRGSKNPQIVVVGRNKWYQSQISMLVETC